MFLTPPNHPEKQQQNPVFSEQIPYIPANLQPKFKKNIKIITFSKTPKNSKNSHSLSKTQAISSSFCYKPQIIQAKTFKLPAVCDLLTVSPK